jgi:hypothetical protein
MQVQPVVKDQGEIQNREGYERDIAIVAEDALVTGHKVDPVVFRQLAQDYGTSVSTVVADFLREVEIQKELDQ